MAGVLLKVKGLPIPQGSMTCVGGGPGRPHNVQPSNKAELNAWRNLVAAAAKRAVDELNAGWVSHDPVQVEVTFTLERPKSVTRDWPSVHPDLDKLARAVLDGLTKGEIWADDGQCVVLNVTKAYPDAAVHAPRPGDVLDVPGAVIRITDAPANRLI